jgi:acetolactate synthase I/II/III large subunit
VPTHIPIVSDAGAALQEMERQLESGPEDHQAWLEELHYNKEAYPLWFNNPPEGMTAQWAVKKIYEATDGDAIVTTDVGQHQMWAAQYFQFTRPDRWVTSGGLGTMGFGFPAAIGCQLARPEENVIAIVGDGGFQMTLQELSVLQERNLPVKVVILNNQALGMVRQWQEEFYEERYSESLVSCQPDFVKLADSYSIRGVKIESQKDFEEQIGELMSYNGPVLIDARVIQQENVFPMVPPGRGINDMVGVKP